MTCRRGLRQLYMAPDVPDRTECPTTSSGEKQGRKGVVCRSSNVGEYIVKWTRRKDATSRCYTRHRGHRNARGIHVRVAIKGACSNTMSTGIHRAVLAYRCCRDTVTACVSQKAIETQAER